MAFSKDLSNNEEILKKALLVVSEFNKLNFEYLQSQSESLKNAALIYFQYINKFQEAIKESSHKLENVPIQLSNFNWFVCNLMTVDDYNLLHEYLIQNDENSLDDFMIKYIEKYKNQIKNSLIQSNPKREVFINEIFKALKKKNYVTLIPLCLIQSDGLFQDAFNKNIFQYNQRKPFIDKKLKEDLFTADRFMYNVLGSTIPIYDNQDNHLNKMNRHRILHGIDINYANKKYCYQSISFLKFISDMAPKTN